jgi:RNA polymerase-binding transcription factor DksA
MNPMPNEAPTAETADVDYAALLRTEQAGLQAQLTELGFGEPADTGLNYDSNFADSSQVTAERGEAERLATELRESLDEVGAALARLQDGSYGLCDVCGKPIGSARLEAMPAARRCIADAAKQ